MHLQKNEPHLERVPSPVFLSELAQAALDIVFGKTGLPQACLPGLLSVLLGFLPGAV